MESAPGTYLPGGYFPVLVLLVVAAGVVLAPLLEEVLFRGFMLPALRSAGVSLALAAVASSGIWALMHVQYDLLDMSVIFAMGLGLAVARERTGSLVACFAMHAIVNAVSLGQTMYVAGELGGGGVAWIHDRVDSVGGVTGHITQGAGAEIDDASPAERVVGTAAPIVFGTIGEGPHRRRADP